MSLFSSAIQRGTRAAQPAATTVVVGTLYFVTDESKIERSSGTSWESYSNTGPGSGTVTNTGTLTDHAVVVGNGSADVSALAVGTALQILTSGGAGADPSWITGGKVAQVVYTTFNAVNSGSTRIPIDDTIPQITEGDEYMTQAITPTNAASTLIIFGLLGISSSASSSNNVALFQDATANAIWASNCGTQNAVGWHQFGVVLHAMTAGTTSSTTFRVRAATNSGTLTFNGTAAAREYGVTPKSILLIMEILP